jgi:hypothetical protein
MFTRPLGDDMTDGVHVELEGTREITILEITTTHTENMVVCSGSFWDAINNDDGDYLKPVCAYSATYETEYDDEYWTYNAGAQFGINEMYYGLQSYWSDELF